MKKGCFLKFIVIFTIIVAAILYIVENKFYELFLEPGKELVISAIEKSWNKDLEFIKETEEKDSLKSLLKYFVSRVESSEKLTSSNSKNIFNYLEITFSDSTIDTAELSHIAKLIKDVIKNEE